MFKMEHLAPGERSRAVYEEFLGYIKPPLVPVRDISDPEFFRPFEVRASGVSRFIALSLARVTGFARFMRTLPDALEEKLRMTNLRLPGIFAPVISATAALEDDPRSPQSYLRAATLVWAARSLYYDLRSGRLSQDTSRGKPLEMGQYGNLFGTSVVLDGPTVRLFKSTDTDHILVLVRGRMYVVDILGLGESMSIDALALELAALADAPGEGTSGPTHGSPGIFTCVRNQIQLRAFRRLQSLPVNRETLQKTRHTLLTLCLDVDDRPSSDAEAMLIAHSRNSWNRWFHASVQIVVFGNAKACGIYSFSAYLDGNVMMRASSEMQRRAVSAVVGATPASARISSSRAVALQWELDRALLRKAEAEYQNICDRQQATFVVDGIGRTAFQRHEISPVQAFVVALQLTARQLVGRCVNIEQFLTMSAYRCMDLVTPNVTTPALVSFVEQYARGIPDPSAFRAELQRVIESLDECARKARSALPLVSAISLFLASRPVGVKVILNLSFGLLMGLLQVTGRLKRGRREVVISHPTIFPEVSVVGRPGIRLPYARYFGLHYQMFEERTVITMMPGVTWNVPNERVIQLVHENLQKILTMLGEPATTSAPTRGT